MTFPAIESGIAYVWRIRLGDRRDANALRGLLSDDERTRADSFDTDDRRMRYTAAHAWKRRILSHYVGIEPRALEFSADALGKPSLSGRAAAAGLHFNLSRSGDIALVALSCDGPIGVDVERWKRDTDYLHVAEQYFSVAEYDSLRSLADDSALLMVGFFAAWTRKEAYLKATGHGIARGLRHFDVTIIPGVPARLSTDRLDSNATREWALHAITLDAGYSAA